MAEQYRRDDEHGGRRDRWNEPPGSERGDDRMQRGGDWRGGGRPGGQSGRGDEPTDDRSDALSSRGGISRETGFDRGISRDERNSRDWQQRVNEEDQGYRTQDRQSDRDWQGEPDWQPDRPRGWQGGREWSANPGRRADERRASDEPWHQSHEQWRGSHEQPGRTREGYGAGRGDYSGRRWQGPYQRGGSRDWPHDSAAGRDREPERERFGTGGGREREQDWDRGGRDRDQDWSRRQQQVREREWQSSDRGPHRYRNEGYEGGTWQARGEEPDRAHGGWARQEARWREERGREGGRAPGGDWPWGGGGPMPTWGIGGSESPRGVSATRESAWPGYSGRGPKGYKRSDERIREDVSDWLMDDRDVDASEITVEVKDGDVTLTGTVQDREQKRRAEMLAERINGVSNVTNNLRVTRPSGGPAWQTAGNPGSQQVGQHVPIGGQQSWQGIRSSHDQGSQAVQPRQPGQPATQAGQPRAQGGQPASQPGHQVTQAGPEQPQDTRSGSGNKAGKPAQDSNP